MPTFTGEDGVKMGSCDLFLTKEDDTELDMLRKLMSGDNGLLRCMPNVQERDRH
jgi:hypothetical protein